MAIKQVSERIIKEKFMKLDELNHTIVHNESDLYYWNNIVYKILKQPYRNSRLQILYLLEQIQLPHANNIIDTLYQGDKLIGSTSMYLKDYKDIKEYMHNLDLYEIKILISYILVFFKESLQHHLLFWDFTLKNMGISEKKFYILDIDSMELNPNDIQIQYALNAILTIFYEMYYKKCIRNDFDNFNEIIFKLSNSHDFKNYSLSIEKIEKIIKNTSYDFLEEKKLILENKKI